MIRHQKCHGVSDVDKFLNDSGLKLDQVQIVYGLSKFGGDYYVFYDEPAKKPKMDKSTAMTSDGQELLLVPVERTAPESYEEEPGNGNP